MTAANAGEFDGRVAVVTGASLGIGAAVVRRLNAGRACVAFCARERERVDALVEECASADRVRGYVADMGDAAQTESFLGEAEGAFGPPDILVNNVGQAPSRNFLYMSDDDWHALFELNLMAAVRCTRHLLPAMRRQRWGRIVMIGTGSVKYPNAATIDYSASKAALVATGKALARKYGSDNVLVNSVLPGLIRTDMWERTAAELAEASGSSVEEVFAARSANVPLGRYGTAEEVADLVAFLCSERASYLTGTAIDIDGGLGTHVF